LTPSLPTSEASEERVRLKGPQRIVVVANPKSRLSPDRLETLVRAYMPEGSHVVVRHTKPDTPIHGLIEDELDLATIAIASGGDGTVSQVAAAILDRAIPLGIVPAGSTNMVAKVSNIPSNPERAVQLIFGYHRRERIDVGRSGERLLLHLGGAGLDARIFVGADPKLKRRIRWAAYVPPAVTGSFAGQTDFTVTVDGDIRRVRSSLVLVANSAQLLSSKIHLVGDVSRTDGTFDVLIYTASNPMQLALAGLFSLTGRLEPSGQVVRLRGKSIRIESDPPVPAELDGEVVGETPLDIDVLPSAIELIRG
jgi:diacylglycerol kinase family enzyme